MESRQIGVIEEALIHLSFPAAQPCRLKLAPRNLAPLISEEDAARVAGGEPTVGHSRRILRTDAQRSYAR
jgi:hypothetical protein